MQDLHELPKLRDSLSYLYVERAVIERNQKAVEFLNDDGRVFIPVASLGVLMLGPGTRITHSAVKTLAENGVTILWTAEDGNNFYAQGMGETRKAHHLLRQVEMLSNPQTHEQVVLQMYRQRFATQLDPGLTLPQIRGFEGVRMRKAYHEASRTYGVPWQGRKYDRGHWDNADPINRALSAANALLNGVCHVAIISGGYSPALGFIHTGKQLSFVYDIADLYKTELTIPTAFKVVAESQANVEARTRAACRLKFREARLLDRILPDIDALLQITDEYERAIGDVDADPALPERLWDELEEEA